uniref:Nucleolar protein 12 n=2 Tax=Eptatretus burgeri TaxID=7764 RepID=A0A8C4QBW6_EPTBU
MGWPQKKRSINRHTKLHITFSEQERHEYLTGFHKRKQERRVAAQEELQKKIREEKRKLKEERREHFIQQMRERKATQGEEFEDFQDLVTERAESVHYDHPGHTVTVTTVTSLDFTRPTMINMGANEFQSTDASDKGTGDEDEVEEERKSSSKPKIISNHCSSQKLNTLQSSLHKVKKITEKGNKAKKRRRWQLNTRHRGGQIGSKRQDEKRKHHGSTTKREKRRRDSGRRAQID